MKEISKSFNNSIGKIYKLKIKTLSRVRHIISNQMTNNSKEPITYEAYLNYLMQLWMHKGYKKRKVR